MIISRMMTMILNDYDNDGDVISCLLRLFERCHLKLAFTQICKQFRCPTTKVVLNSVAFLVGSVYNSLFFLQILKRCSKMQFSSSCWQKWSHVFKVLHHFASFHYPTKCPLDPITMARQFCETPREYMITVCTSLCQCIALL